jgi:hypothetical protein
MSRPVRVLPTTALLALVLVSSPAGAQTPCDAPAWVPNAQIAQLEVKPTALVVEDLGGHRVVTTLATLRNPLAACFDQLVVEVQYFDAAHAHVDTLTLPIQVPAPAGGEVEIRVRGDAAREKPAYASQSARVVAGVPHRGVPPKEEPGLVMGLVLSWAPMVLLIAVWGFFIRRMNRPSTPNGRIAAAAEAQAAAILAQTRVLERIADSLQSR